MNNNIIKFGEAVEGYDMPVLNEREIRAAAGILFVMMFFSILKVIFTGNFITLKYAIVIFLVDILIRVFVNPRFSPSLIIGRFMVKNQVPEYVGAAQKKFAWIIGVVLAAAIFVHLDVINAFSPITGLICFICLIFLFFESAFGICIGCKFYSLFHKEKAKYCPGEVCEIKSRQDIQKISKIQVFVVAVFIAFIFLTALMFNDNFNRTPHYLFSSVSTSQTR